MPQTGKTENTIQFNYFVGGILKLMLNIEMVVKNFKLYKGAEKSILQYRQYSRT